MSLILHVPNIDRLTVTNGTNCHVPQPEEIWWFSSD